MILLRNIGSLVTGRAQGSQADVHVIHNAALIWSGSAIRWLGAEADLPAGLDTLMIEDVGGRMVVPGLVDCHTHLAFGGWREDEFERRCRGDNYLDIAAEGGGILSTVRATRKADESALVERSLGFLESMMQLGVTTIEAKSGYGLSLEDELKILRAYRTVADRSPATIVPTLLAAHALPPEYAADRAGYLRLITEELIPAVAREKLAEFVDVFVEESAFTIAEARQVLAAGQRHGLGAKLHADQLTSGGGGELAAELGAVSADHLEHVSDAGIRQMAERGVVAVSLPIASLYLRQPTMPARRLMDMGVPVAVATDFNPGSAPSYHLPLALMLACTTQGMTPGEALKGATIIAAGAVGKTERVGSLEPGKQADFAFIEADSVNDWLYHFRPNACVRTIIAGRTVWRT